MVKKVTGTNSLSYMGVQATTPPQLVIYNRNPTSNDYAEFEVGTLWITSTTPQEIWMLTDKKLHVSTWSQLSSPSTTINSIIAGDDITVLNPTGPDVTVGITNGANGQLLIGGGSAATWANLTSLDGSVTITNAANSIDLSTGGGSGVFTSVTATTGDITATLGNLNIPAGSVTFGALTNGVLQTNATGVVSATNGTDGQLLIGGGTAPVWTNLTSSAGSIVITNSANGINLESSTASSGKLITWSHGQVGSGTNSSLAVHYGSDGWWMSTGQDRIIGKVQNPVNTWSYINTPPRNPFPTSTYITDVAYGNGYWVVVGDSLPYIAVSPTPPDTFTAPVSIPFATKYVCVGYGNGYWVACTTTNKLAYAADPTGTWTENVTFALTSNINSIAYGNGYWVVVGIDKLAVATDPTGAWTLITTPWTTLGNMMQVKFLNNHWVVVGQGGSLMTTGNNPTTGWTLQTTSAGNGTMLYCVAYGDGVYVAPSGYYDSNGSISSDLITWKNNLTVGDGTQVINDVDFNGGYFVAVGGGHKIWTGTVL